MLKKILNKLSGKSSRSKTQPDDGRVLISKRQHGLSSKQISPNAIKVMLRLERAGHEAYLVGGGVRDLLIGKAPKDFDLATSASPEQVRKIFRNCRLIGRRFRLAHIYFKGEIIEVSTFRSGVEQSKDKAVLETLAHDNVYGTLAEDAWRRDFTVNSLYLSAKDLDVLDYTDGITDLDKKLIRIIGDPSKRFHEDPVRILRAIRLAAKLEFNIEEQTAAQIKPCLHLLDLVPGARIFDEMLKILFQGYAQATVPMLKQYNVWQKMFPLTMHWFEMPKTAAMYQRAFVETDARVVNAQSLNPGFLLAVLLWPEVWQRFEKFNGTKKQYIMLRRVANEVLSEQLQILRIPKRLQIMMLDVWLLQLHLQRRRPSSAETIVRQRYFRAAFDLLLLYADGDSKLTADVQAWRKLRDARPAARREYLKSWNNSKPVRRRRHKKPKANQPNEGKDA